MAETSLGLEENVEAVLAYLLGFITGILFLVLEKKSQFVRFHAAQSLVTFLGLFVLMWFLAWVPFVGLLLVPLLNLLGLALWLLLMYKAYKGEMFKLPVVGNIAESIIPKIQE